MLNSFKGIVVILILRAFQKDDEFVINKKMKYKLYYSKN